MRGGIPRKGLTAQWLQQFVSSTEVSTPFCNTFNSRYTEFFFTLPSVVSPSWDQLAPLSVAPFAVTHILAVLRVHVYVQNTLLYFHNALCADFAVDSLLLCSVVIERTKPRSTRRTRV